MAALTAPRWSTRADQALLVALPDARRAMVEIVFVAALVLGGHASGIAFWVRALMVAALALVAVGLVAPWSPRWSGFGQRVFALLVALAAVFVSLGPGDALLAKDHVIVATALRDLVLIVFLLTLARVDGQPLAALGIAREGAVRELRAALPVTLGVFAVQVTAAVPIALLASLFHSGEHEATERIDTLGRLSGQSSLPAFLAALVVAATFEEVCFRAFLTPRVRALTGSWSFAAVIVSLLFGLGHMYEGTLAVAQTAILGLYFTAAFLARRRLLAVVVAHATFNAVMFVFVRAILASGAIDRLKALAPH
jgi:membrane protease YdiL (CAAX protease family)